jgi:Zn-dependent hydrolases, including glyoxylases
MHRSFIALCGVLGWLCFGSPAMAAEPLLPFVTQTAGGYELVLLSEGDAAASTDILLDAGPELLREVAPYGTYPGAINVFLLRGKDRNILIDTGFGTTLFSDLERLGMTPADIDAVLLTHMHPDHIGGLMRDGTAAFPRAELFVAKQERAYWTDPANTGEAFGGVRQVLAAYEGRVQVFSPGPLEQMEEVLPEVRAGAAFGHTPGHTVFLAGALDSHVLVWGDVTHAMAVQMPAPQVAVVYDVDPEAAVASRMNVLRYAAGRGIIVTGMHIPSPAFGVLSNNGQGGFVFTPVR